MRKRKLISALFIGLSLFLLMGQNCGFSGQEGEGVLFVPGMFNMMNAFGVTGFGGTLY